MFDYFLAKIFYQRDHATLTKTDLSCFLSWAFNLLTGPCMKYVRNISRKTKISNPLIRTRTSAYQGVRNFNFSENFAYVLHAWPLRFLWDHLIFFLCLREASIGNKYRFSIIKFIKIRKTTLIRTILINM